MVNVISTSIFTLVLKNLSLQYYYFGMYLDEVVKNSQIYKLIISLREGAAVSFKSSFLGKISEDNKSYSLILRSLFDNSKYVRASMHIFEYSKVRIMIYLFGSNVVKFLKMLEKKVYLYPLRAISVFITVVIITNMLTYSLININIGLLGWGVRGMLLFIGINGLNSGVAWEELKNTSFFLKKSLNNSCKI